MNYTKVKIIADTLSPNNVRITTFQVYAPRYLLAEVNTHRVIAKSAASSRAIPIARRLEMVRAEPYVPDAFGKNKPGMQSDELLEEDEDTAARTLWMEHVEQAATTAEKLAELSVHKQQANRILEPFVYYNGVMTSTEWDNFWNLRVSEDADPGFEYLARLMKEAYDSNTPKRGRLHLPYTDDCPEGLTTKTLANISSARCARVSYTTFDGKPSSIEDDVKLCADLRAKGHLSPFDHPAFADSTNRGRFDDKFFWSNPDAHRHNFGWIPYRVDVENEAGLVCRRNSHAPVTKEYL